MNTKLENQNGHRQKITPGRRDRKKLETPGTELNQTKPVYSVTHIYSTKQVTQEKRERKNTELASRLRVTRGMRDRKNTQLQNQSAEVHQTNCMYTQLHTYSTTQVTQGMRDQKIHSRRTKERK